MNLERQNCREMRRRVNNLVVTLNLPENEFLGLNHVALIDDHFTNYQITIYGIERNDEPIYYNKSKSFKQGIKYINILYHDGHFSTIKSIHEFYKCSYYCYDCKIRFSNIGIFFFFVFSMALKKKLNFI